MNPPVLDVAGLRVSFGSGSERYDVVRGIDLSLAAGEILGLIGESGSGKTMIGLSIARLLPSNADVSAVRLTLSGRALDQMDDREFQAIRGTGVAMVFQDPAGALNPAKSIGWQLHQVMLRGKMPMPEGWHAAAMAALTEVGIHQPREVLKRYPHQLSGGMLQRVLIAAVLALRPALIIADEPTTNLDRMVEEQVLDLFRMLRNRHRAAFIFITHDIAVAASVCDRIAVMYAGEIVETGPADQILTQPLHPYTQGLLRISRGLVRGQRLAEMPGILPRPGEMRAGCAFAPRCPSASLRCEFPLTQTEPTVGHTIRCVLYA